MKRLLLRKIPFYFFAIATGLLLLIIYHLNSIGSDARLEIQHAMIPAQNNSEKIEQIRLKEYQFTKPLLLTEVRSESGNLKDIKRALDFEINTQKSNGTITDASVYLRRLNSGEWTSVNSSSEYAPGSVIKIAAMITYLKMCEGKPDLLNREFLFQGKVKGTPNQTFNDDPLVAGRRYTAKDLLYRVIVNSDNDATLIINESLDLNLFRKFFTDIGIAEPNVRDRNFKMDVINLSKFMRILFNSTYLSSEHSEFALTLLSKSTFTKGIVDGLPKGIKIAHKFGETGTANEAQLHETAIVYYDDQPYLITIMTKGKEVHRLPEVLSDLSRIAYENLSGKKLSLLQSGK